MTCKRRSRAAKAVIPLALVVCNLDSRAQSIGTPDPSSLMPRVEDYTSMWWAEGFPTVVPDAPWRRVIQTGLYAMVLDTETLKIPHLGAVPSGTSYADCGLDDIPIWKSLPSAELELKLDVNGKSYRCTGGGKWTRFTGPRLIESGRFFQRADVTDLVFESSDGRRLNVEARFETAAWPERLGLIFSARPGLQAIRAGEISFGRVGGGFGLDGTNHFEIPHAPELDPERFTLEFWAFVPIDYRASVRAWPWLVCKNRNENADGNFGIMVIDGKAQARMNIGGGNEGAVILGSKPVRLGAWNHFLLSYDGEALRFSLNGAKAGEEKIGRRRKPGRHALVFGRREDNSGDGYHFRGVVDEIRLYDRPLGPAELRQQSHAPVGKWSFRADGQASMTRLREAWKDPALEIRLTSQGKTLRRAGGGDEAALAFAPANFKDSPPESPVIVDAGERPVEFDRARGWHRINLDGVEPVVPAGDAERRNDAIERVNFSISNPTAGEQIARLMFEKTARGIRHGIGSPITGVSAILRDAGGFPTGIPVQLSKNWHNHPEGGVYSGQWFHGISQVRLPAGAKVELELAIAYGHWGGVAAASHAQLSLIGWGTNQRWDESALGSWGESICYDPAQIQGKCSITDVRPLMVRPMGGDKERWSWTSNVGGGDFFRMFDKTGERVSHAAMRATYRRYGPCLTEVTYAGRIGKGIRHSATVSLTRTDDVVRGTYRLRLDVKQATDISRLVLFQVGADTYNKTREAKMALGNEDGLAREWATLSGHDGYRIKPLECTGRIPWISLHEGAPTRKSDDTGAWANRGIVIRSWKANLGGKPAPPWVAEHGVSGRGSDSSTLDIVPPPGVTRLEPDDFVEATIEHIVVPQFARDYYGPNEALRRALRENENTWRMIHREAIGNDRQIEVASGTLERRYPDVGLETKEEMASFTISGGIGYVPFTFTGLKSPGGYLLSVNGQPIDQSIHGNDFWQTDFDPASRRWSRTYNIPIADDQPHSIRFAPAK